MKSIIMFFALAFFIFNTSNAQDQDFAINMDHPIPQVTFGSKGKKKKRRGMEVAVNSSQVVTFKLTEALNSDEVTVGQHIQLMVDLNVVVDGEVIIRSNAYAIGRVKAVKNSSSINYKSTLTIEMVSVQAVDGQQIPLNGQEQIFTSERPGQNVILNAGKTVTGFFKNNETITIK